MILAQYYFILFGLCINEVTSLAIQDVIEDDDEVNAHSGAVFDQIVKNNQATGEKTWLFEGDIALEDEPEKLKGRTPDSSIQSNMLKRSLRRTMEYLWIDRVVPYEFTSDVDSNKDTIKGAMDEISRKSCISFVNRTNEKNWIKFFNKGSCFSSVGRSFWTDGYQIISLSSGCQQNKGTIMHEILHALGFWHEQSRTDRNKYVEIMWENIAKGEEHNFAKYTRGESDDLNSLYDYSSIMHYGRASFSKNGKPTILAINDKDKVFGQRNGLSAEDVTQLNALYRCQEVGQVYTSWSDWSPCDNTCGKTRQRFCSNYDAVKCPEANSFGVHNEVGRCSDAECYKPRDGHWGKWSSWAECSHDCGKGTTTRTRNCDDPAVKYGGNDCSGSSLETKSCYIKPCGLGQDDCQFDGQGTCFWTDVSAEQKKYKWERHQGKTLSGSTGPSGDHTTSQTNKNGYYMYTESSGPATTGNKASLQSKSFSSISNRCLTFFYSMHGLGIGALRVFVVDEVTGTQRKIWEKTGPQGSDWKEADVDILSQNSYKIRFESERGASFQGDIGIDDVYFVDRKCAEKYLEIITTTATTTATTTTTPKPTTTTISPLQSFCGVPIKPLGCFSDVSGDNALPLMLDSHRGDGPLYHGPTIDWQNYKTSLKLLLCECINRAKDKNMKFIGLQYYGECFGGLAGVHYNRHGISTKCIDSGYRPCQNPTNKDICIGEGDTNYVYELL